MKELYDKIEGACEANEKHVCLSMEEVAELLKHLVNNKEVIDIYSKWIDDMTARMQTTLKKLN